MHVDGHLFIPRTFGSSRSQGGDMLVDSTEDLKGKGVRAGKATYKVLWIDAGLMMTIDR